MSSPWASWASCQDCPLAATRKQVVLPDGPVDAEYVLVGEAPGEDEDKEGRPFVGRSGKKLDYLLSLAGIKRADVLVTNTVMCRPPANRDPKAPELLACRKHLDAVLSAAPRKAVLAIGDFAIKQIAGKGITLKSHHGRRIDDTNPVVLPLYHPAAAMHNPNLIPVLSDDYRRIRQEIARKNVTRGTHEFVNEADWMSLTEELTPPWVAFDLETTWIKDRVGDVEVVGYSLSLPGFDHAWFIRGGLDKLAQYLRGAHVVAHNAQFEYQVMKAQGVTLDAMFDTKLAAYVLGYPVTDLKSLVLQKYGYQMKRLEELSDNFKMPVEEIDPDALADYGADDAFWTGQLRDDLSAELNESNLMSLYQGIELPVIPVLGDVMLRGVQIDRAKLTEANTTLSNMATSASDQIKQSLGNLDINLNSGDQLAAALFNKKPMGLGLPVIKLTESHDRPSTDKQVLEVLAQRYPITSDILEYRHIEKLRTTYAEGILKRTSDERPRLFAHFNQAGGFEDRDSSEAEAPSTGRLSSSGPNLTNIPKHDAPGLTAIAPLIRRCFVAQPGYKLVVGDLAQEEFRIAAFLSQDPAMLDIITNGKDWHALTAMTAFNRATPADLQGDERYYGKQGNFSKLNGATPARVALAAKCGLPIATKICSAFDLLHTRYQEWRDEEAVKIEDSGFAYTWFGRRRFLPGIWSKDEYTRAEAIRQGVNMPIQGTAADILKIVLVRMENKLQTAGIPAGLVLIVHDELVYEVLDKDVPAVVQLFEGVTTDLLDDMPLPVEIEVGNNWAAKSPTNPEGLVSYDEYIASN